MDFSQIALLFVIAAGFGLIAKLTRQPLLIGYLFAGVFIGATGLIADSHAFESIGAIGVALLLFLLGLEMNVRELPSVGKIALLTGFGQILGTTVLGYALSSFLGYDFFPSLYIALALTFASTIIVIKVLSEKKDLQSLYGRISIGVLLIQDVVAILILMFLSGLKRGEVSGLMYAITFVKALILFAVIWFLSKKVLPYLFEKYFSGSHEFLFIISIAWALGIAAFVGGPLGFSIEIGGFLAGIALSTLPEHLQIAGRVRPLRDFFLTIFFVSLGTTFVIDAQFLSILFPSILLSLFVLLSHVGIIFLIMSFMGHRRRTSFMTGLTVSQISEFSFILMAMGLALGHVTQTEVSLIVFVGVITMTVSTYLVLESEKIYRSVEKILKLLERNNVREVAITADKTFSNHIILIGCDRTGRHILPFLSKLENKILVIDFNPLVVNRLEKKKVPVIFGDMNDLEVLDLASVKEAIAIISTTGTFSDNLLLLEQLKVYRYKPLTVFTAANRHEAQLLYKNGATYVLLPEVIAGSYIKSLLKSYGVDKKKFERIGRRHYKNIRVNS